MPIEKDRLRAEFCGGAKRHGRMDAEAPGLVARRGDHAALVALPADDNRQAAQFRPGEELDRDKESVHINVKDRGTRFGRRTLERVVLGAKMG